ncbi:MAG TPA: TonB-dependent receptor [Rhodanobacteraceae bacterium]|nr:TonB-dependent receptor [Rhodanobacteraceae bacterium]
MSTILSRNTHARKFLRVPLALAIAAACCTLVTPPAGAQDAGSAAQSQPKVLQSIEVTGTRIKKADIATQVPVITITSQQIQQTGLASIGDVLQQLSVSGSSLNTKFNSAGNFGFAPDGSGVGSGATTMSLRNMGPQRTLVLVDGLRWVNGSSASGVADAVDLNTIPAGIVERVEILPNGASSLYGSDAIAGVINIITKKSQQGAAAHVYYGDYAQGHGSEGQTWSGDLSFGGHGDRFNFFVDISHYKQNGISSADWDRSSICVPGTGLANCSSATPFTRVLFDTPNGQAFGGLCPDGFCNIAANGVAGAGGVQAFPGGYHPWSNADRFNFAPYNLLLTPSTRTGFFSNVQYRINDDVSWYFRGMYSNRKSVNQAAPEPIFLGQAFCMLIDRCFTTSVDATNPYNPFGFTLSASSPDMGIGRRPVEGGPRIFTQNVNTRYYASGFEGQFGIGERNFNWDFNFIRSDNDATQDVTGTYNSAHIQEALGPISLCDADPTCVPLNLFGGPGTITPDMLKYILYHEHDTSHQAMGVISADISGDVLKLPAGWLDFAAGVQRQTLSGSYQPDAVVAAGDSNGVPSAPTAGGYSVNSFYAEFNIPVLADVALAKALNVDLSSRYSDYSTFGSTTDSSIGIRWQVVSDLTLRGDWGQGFRAPSIGELFGTSSRFDATLVDPCNFDSPIHSAQVAANCQVLGVPNPATFQQSNTQISILTGGNHALQPERSRNIALGGVYSPSWAANTAWSQKLDFDLTYFKIALKNAIEAPDAQTLLNRCAETLDPAFCSGQVRTAAGQVAAFNDILENLGRIDTNGFDFGVNWTGNRTSIGTFSANWQSTYVQHFRATNLETGLQEPGTTGIEVNNSAIPRLRSQIRLNWALGHWTASWAVRYISALTEDCGGAGGFPICKGAPTARFPDGSNHLGATAYNDARLSWRLPVALPLTVSGGINNLLDRQPPTCLSCTLNGYDASTYDLPGRFYYFEANVKF